MKFENIVNDVKKICFDTLRKDTSGYFEAVILKKEIQSLSNCLEKFFGIPLYPSQNSLSFEVQRVIDDFGGITSGQTLYYSGNKEIVFAMLWPWQDGMHITVKIARK
jgi:hypothetical protein